MAHIAARAGIIVVSAAVAAAVAFYESPEVRRHADRVRRRVATALHQLGDNINPITHQPMFNHPEDAFAFFQSQEQGVPDGPPGVDADEESRRRQREEIIYWNAVREQRDRQRQVEEEAAMRNKEGHVGPSEKCPSTPTRGTSFDDFLKQDRSAAETGAFVFNSGANIWGQHTHGFVHRRGDGTRAADTSIPTGQDSFSDQNGVERAATPTPTDIYSATTHDIEAMLANHPEASITAVDDEELAALARQLAVNESSANAGSNTNVDRAFANVQAWARDSQPAFYSPLPMTPVASMSEPSIVSSFEGHEDGQATPTDSASIADSGVEVDSHPSETVSPVGDGARPFDVISESEGMATPASWSEVGSVVSEEENWQLNGPMKS